MSRPDPPIDAGSWEALHPRTAMAWLDGVGVRWWIAGGWALELFANQPSRPHGDLDAGVLRRDVAQVQAHLSSWEIFEVSGGVLRQLSDGVAPRPEVNSLWCRPNSASPWRLQLLLDESEAGEWVFRRDARIRRPLASIVWRSADGYPCLAPEIQLLYKAKQIRPRDQADFEVVAPLLDAGQRGWLRESLGTVHPGHHWIGALSQ